MWEATPQETCSTLNLNQRTNGPVNAHLISGPSISKNILSLVKIAEQTLTLILIIQDPSFNHLIYYMYINQIPAHRMQ